MQFEFDDAMRSTVIVDCRSEVRHIGLSLRGAIGDIEIFQRKRGEISLFTAKQRERHRNRQTPITEMIFAPHLSTEAFEHARKRIADDRRTQVTDMHLLRDIDAAQVDDHSVRVG